VLALALAVRHARRGALGTLVLAGLLTSAAADVAIEWSFLAGVALFLAAHVLYVAAFVADERALRAWRALPFASYAASMYAFLRPGLGAFAVPVGAYVVAIAAMMWRAAARVHAGETAGRWALCGALAFGLSDSLLALHRFHQPLPGASVAIMLSYWAGQLGIALSATGPGRSARSRTAAAAPVASDTQAPASTDAR
jgi:alkenylglycerophosphocholine/alkenylglycerophosphoethanolamine hydrolase